ncbi:MAG TPA: YicC/YloC family endoribonuclease, partial [Longimicrobiales bacterium]
MIRSMTGFGEAELDTPAGRLHAELKTVNHRFFSAQLRLPTAAERYDGTIREWLRAFLPRGHVNYSLRIESVDESAAGPAEEALAIDLVRAHEYKRVLTRLKEELDLPGEVDVALLSRYGDLIAPADTQRIELDADALRGVTEDAARACTVLREEEGRKLRADLEGRLAGMEAAMAVTA